MSERAPVSLAEPFRSLADVQALLDSRINYEADQQVSVERIFTLDRHPRRPLHKPAYRTAV